MGKISGTVETFKLTQSEAMAKIRDEMSRGHCDMTPARIRNAGIPGRLGADQLARHYGLKAHGEAGGYWSYIRA